MSITVLIGQVQSENSFLETKRRYRIILPIIQSIKHFFKDIDLIMFAARDNIMYIEKKDLDHFFVSKYDYDAKNNK
jgi:hypothetical protein